MKLIVIRKRRIISIVSIILCITLIVCIAKYYVYQKTVATLLPGTTKVIVIDAGHGGVDPGAIGRNLGVLEKDVNLAIAKYLKEYLEQSGSKVIMTRKSDKGLYSLGGTLRQKKNEDLRNRKAIVNKSNANIFITIHLNSFPQSQYYGAQTFYPKDNPTGKILAEKIQGSLIEILDNNNSRVALSKEGIYLIKGLDIPTALIECGFLSNPKEEKLLNSTQYQKKVAWAIYVGIQKYFEDNP